VRAQQAEDLARLDVEADALDGLDAAWIGLRQRLDLDRRSGSRWSVPTSCGRHLGCGQDSLLQAGSSLLEARASQMRKLLRHCYDGSREKDVTGGRRQLANRRVRGASSASAGGRVPHARLDD